MLPFFCPTLRGGGELDPREDVPTLADAEGEERVARYVGRRTGRRSIANGGGGGLSRQHGGGGAIVGGDVLPSAECVVASRRDVLGMDGMAIIGGDVVRNWDRLRPRSGRIAPHTAAAVLERGDL